MLKNNKLPKLMFLAFTLTLLFGKSASAYSKTFIKPKIQASSFNCCIDKYINPVSTNRKRAQKLVGEYAIKEEEKLIIKYLPGFFNGDEHIYPVKNGRVFNIPAGKFSDFRGTRVSLNFDHKSWVPRGSNPVKVRFTVHGVNDDTRRKLRVHMRADKHCINRDREPGILQHGSVFDLKYGTGRDRAYYFVARNSVIRPEDLPKGAYFRLERL